MVLLRGAESEALTRQSSASPKPHPSKPHPRNMPQVKSRSCSAIFGKLRCRNCTATFAFLQCGRHFTKGCVATSEKLHCNIERAALQESGVFLPLSCGFQTPTFRPPRLGPAESERHGVSQCRAIWTQYPPGEGKPRALSGGNPIKWRCGQQGCGWSNMMCYL